VPFPPFRRFTALQNPLHWCRSPECRRTPPEPDHDPDPIARLPISPRRPAAGRHARRLCHGARDRPPAAAAHQLEREIQLGLTEFEKIKKDTPISRDAAAAAWCGRSVSASRRSRRCQCAMEFVLFDEPKTPNAFCLPGGKVGVSSGILSITRDETGLATVIGHESRMPWRATAVSGSRKG